MNLRTAILAHGVGGRQDLPLPLGHVIIGAVAALVVSFVLLIWTTRRYAADTADHEAVVATPARKGWPVPRLAAVVDSRWWRWSLRLVGMLLFAYVLIAALLGKDNANNPIFGIVYVWLWVGVVIFSLVLGPAWRAISPARTITAGLNLLRGTSEPFWTYPKRLGYWPAAVGLLAFTWMELVNPSNNYLGPVRLWLAIYLALMIIGGALFGETFNEHCDPFEVYSWLASKLSVWGRTPAGALVVRTPLGNLDTLQPAPGLVAVVCVLFGTITYDSFHDSVPWLEFIQDRTVVAHHLAYPIANLGLVAFPLVVAAFYCIGTMLTGVGDVPRRALPGQLAPSLVPIVVGYVIAHYLSFFWETGQATLRQASDPLGDGGDWFGTSGLQVSYFFAYHATLLADIKVLAVIIGHVLGVWSAHIRALQVLPKRHLVTGQLPLLVTMIGFTIGGLYLLFAA